ncbi:MAG: hypothetical protein ACI4AN_08825 [Muribaculaceae bacterium]
MMMRNNHIKADWETHQFYMKCRDKLSFPMAGPNLLLGAFMPGGLQRIGSPQNLIIGVSSYPFDVAFITDAGKRSMALPASVFFMRFCVFLWRLPKI